jgi:hypothetical protein
MSFFLTKRVISRYLQASASRKLPGLIEDTIRSVKSGDYEEAYNKYGKFLQVIGIFGSVKGDRVRVESPWAHNLTPDQNAEYEKWLGEILNIRTRLQRAAYPSPGEMPQVEDLDWDLGSLRHNFVEWVEPFFRDEGDEFTHGPFKVILAADAQDGLEEALKTLDAASAKIKTKFSQVLYGKVFVTRGLKGGTYKTAPNKAGSYVAATDSINLSLYAVPDRDSIMTLIHEFGHRYHTRFLKGDDREKFIQLHEVGDVREVFLPLHERYKYADEYIVRLKKFRDEDFSGTIKLSKPAEDYFKAFARREDPNWRPRVSPLLNRFNDGEDVEDKLRDELAQKQYGGNLRVVLSEADVRPLHASPYGATSWEENFAECFLHFCIGKVLPDGLQKFMESL